MVGVVNEPTSILSAEIEESIGAIAADHGSADKLQSIATSTADDSDLQKVLHYVQHGWPTPVPDAIKAYQQERHHLSSKDGVIFHGRRIVVPLDMRASIMAKLHEGHQGITKTRARAQVYCWWPGISNDITTYVTGCETCTKRRYQPPEPLSPTDFPERPWQRLASDICEVKGTHYLVTIDYFSRFLAVERLPSLTSAAVINCLTSLFAVHGYPESLVSDNGPQFSCDSFRQFLTSGTITHRTSSPRHPQSNGEAERAVQTAKRLITVSASTAELQKALLAYRSTPLANGFSPAELLFGRRLRTALPCSPALLDPCWPDIVKLREAEAQAKDRQAASFDRRHAVQELSPLSMGTRVWLEDLSREGTVIEQVSGRSYLVATAKGTLRRNRRSLKVLHPLTPPDIAINQRDNPQAEHPPQQPGNVDAPYTLRRREDIRSPDRLISQM